MLQTPSLVVLDKELVFESLIRMNDDGEDVENINVKNCTFYNTSDCVRIKTWASQLKKMLSAFLIYL
ncbi:polygalacturonase [Medicago truncatula]|uniref:Polygalacturonase n=1 Tax=Medicago truncatula TaxID=3880 RepID=G7II67_MEDTR|nr:polygalacturonase [Medicago truncatula]